VNIFSALVCVAMEGAESYGNSMFSLLMNCAPFLIPSGSVGTRPIFPHPLQHCAGFFFS
jgi:hypothetical protein